MTLVAISAACLPFSGRDGRAYYMSEQGQLVRVNFKESRSLDAWAALQPGQHHDLPAASVTDELRLALSRLDGDRDAPLSSPPHISICGEPALSEDLHAALSLSGIRCEIVRDPRHAAPPSRYLLVAAGYFRHRLFRQAEEAYQAAGIPWIPLYLEGRQVRLGPCMGPYLALQDLTARLLSASSSPDVLQDLWHYAETVRFPGLPFPLTGERWLWATAALLFDDWHRGEERGFPPERHQLTLRPATREIIHHPVLRLPSSAAPERRDYP